MLIAHIQRYFAILLQLFISETKRQQYRSCISISQVVFVVGIPIFLTLIQLVYLAVCNRVLSSVLLYKWIAADCLISLLISSTYLQKIQRIQLEAQEASE